MAHVSFKGNIGKVRDIAFNSDGQARFGFSVAEGHGKFDKQTQQWVNTGTTWYAVTVFGRQAEALAEVIREGAKQRVAVAGKQSTREYEANGETRTSLDVIADFVGLIPRAQPDGQQNAPGQYQQRPPQGRQQQPWGQQPGGGQQQSYDWGVPSDDEPPY